MLFEVEGMRGWGRPRTTWEPGGGKGHERVQVEEGRCEGEREVEEAAG